MKDFSAAALARLIPLGMKRLGLVPTGVPTPVRGPHLPIDTKSALLDSIASKYGRAVLLRIGEGLLDAPDEPILAALTMADGPRDLLQRWQRLERYVHSHHRVSCQDVEPSACTTRWVLTHRSTRPGDAPTHNESLLILGMIVKLLEMTGAQDLRVRFSTDPSWRYHNGAWSDIPLPATDLNCWHLFWLAPVFNRDAAVSLEGSNSSTTGIAAPLAERVVAAIQADPARQWRIAQMASQLAVSERTLQRHLRQHGTSFSALLASTRATLAARQLINTAQPAAQVGYICGYADQAHFNRSFRQFAAQTPVQYRRSFQIAAVRSVGP